MSTFTKHLSLADLQSPGGSGAGADGETPILKAVADARSQDYAGICCPLTTDAWRARWRGMCLLPADDGHDKVEIERRAEAWRATPAFERDEVTMTRLDEAEGVVAVASEWLELDATDDWVRHDSETALLQELAYASYLNITSAILPPPKHRSQLASYARAVNTCLNAVPYMELSVCIPIYDPVMLHASSSAGSAVNITTVSSPSVLFSDEPSVATWEMWDAIRTVCEYNPRLTLTLDLTPPMPSVISVLSQWSAEPVRHIFLPASAFIANAKGYPVLPKVAQGFLRDIMKLRPNVILSGTTAGRHKNGGEVVYSQYVRHLEKTSPAYKASKTQGTVENFAQGYQDYLQAPLQPLMDNLQSVTYQTFEQDPVKYRQYEEAVYAAIVEWPNKADKMILCVAGAGRGPLVARCLKALQRASREGLVYALEKNPNAYVTLQQRVHDDWGESVKLFFGDMRTFELPEKVDILVSELLGSFGDNELSPECLDGAMRFLKPEGISIPASYTAHIAPLSSSKLFNETRATKDVKAAETPYVVMFQAINILSGNGGGLSGNCGPKVQECWEFEHPRKDAVLNEQGLPPTNSHNARSAQLTFHIPHAGILHGLAGYFEAVLYRNIGLSIHPDRMQYISKNMLSWFPLLFPFKEPLYLPSSSELHVSIWRLTNQRQVWYEWYAEAFLPVPGSTSMRAKTDAESARPSRSDSLDGLSVTRSDSREGWLVSVRSTPVLSPSPMADAVDIPPIEIDSNAAMEDDAANKNIGLIKIGQTSLHNPKGRSSWIGL
ncbi:PRMT5-domain-containing protein [Fomitopsis serialis]|uniref:PRMT5-domain-containing protein n=1 Tax=Fomitopsis serialis TaxID=139415 RepID=UPI002008363A|nr:PRMT5-domain-containing protein [Neoantrodia serialis]KAH9912809.1 PRMT5-domain-containing protein [Neoantrodia serialis]